MTKIELGQIMAALREVYTAGSDPSPTLIEIWWAMFQGYDKEVVQKAAVEYMSTSHVTKQFPAPGDILEEVRSITGEREAEIELWRAAEKAIRRGSVMTQEDFEALPEEVQTYYGGVSAFRDLGMLPADQLQYEQARFLKQVPQIRKRVEGQKLIAARREPVLWLKDI